MAMSSTSIGLFDSTLRRNKISLGVRLLDRTRELIFFITMARSVGEIGPGAFLIRRISFCTSLTVFSATGFLFLLSSLPTVIRIPSFFKAVSLVMDSLSSC